MFVNFTFENIVNTISSRDEIEHLISVLNNKLREIDGFDLTTDEKFVLINSGNVRVITMISKRLNCGLINAKMFLEQYSKKNIK